MARLESLVGSINGVIWSYLLVGLLIMLGAWFTWRTGFVQFKMFREMLALLVNSGGGRGVSSFWAFAVLTDYRRQHRGG